jgi:hypothetical protein
MQKEFGRKQPGGEAEPVSGPFGGVAGKARLPVLSTIQAAGMFSFVVLSLPMLYELFALSSASCALRSPVGMNG